jgi:hypothetical protein
MRFDPRRLAGIILALGLGLSTGAVGVLSPAAAVDPIPTGSISGTVTGPDEIAVTSAVATVYWFDPVGGTSAPVASRSVDVGGSFFVGRLRAGLYKVGISAPGYESEFVGGATAIDSAQTFAVAQAAIAVPDVTLAVAEPTALVTVDTDLTGVVTDATTGESVPDTNVYAFDAVTDDYLTFTVTDSMGAYTFDDLNDVTVKLGLADPHFGGADLLYPMQWWGGSTLHSATPVVAAANSATVVSPTIVRSAGIRGRVVAPTGQIPISASVEAWDLDTRQITSVEVGDDGTFYLGALNPSQSYKIRVTDARYFPDNDQDNAPRAYFDVWYGDGSDFTSARPVPTGARGTWTPSIEITMRDTLTATIPPRVVGSFLVGRRLTADQGRWNKNAGTTFGYEWLRDGTVVGTGPTRSLTAADAGTAIALRVTNTYVDGDDVRTATATTKAQVVRYASTLRTTSTTVRRGKKAGSRAVTVTVLAGSQSRARLTGTVKVTEGKRRIAAVAVRKGSATFFVTKPGRHQLALTYSGNSTTGAAKGSVTVSVRRGR